MKARTDLYAHLTFIHSVACIHRCIHSCIYTYILAYIHTYIHRCTQTTNIYANIYTNIHTCILTVTHIHTSIRTYICIYIRTYIHTYMRAYIHTYGQTWNLNTYLRTNIIQNDVILLNTCLTLESPTPSHFPEISLLLSNQELSLKEYVEDWYYLASAILMPLRHLVRTIHFRCRWRECACECARERFSSQWCVLMTDYTQTQTHTHTYEHTRTQYHLWRVTS